MPRKTKKQIAFEMECMEREARGRAAWGLYGAYVRQQNLNEEREKLRSDGKSEEDIKKFIQNKSHGYLIVG